MSLLTASVQEIVAAACDRYRRLLLFGPPGVGKSTLASRLGRDMTRIGRECWCIGADPGSPGFGFPGAVALGKWRRNDWQIEEFVALCTLDAGRFRLPVVSAVRGLAQKRFKGTLLIDGPGVVRGVAGTELLAGIVEAAKVDAVVALTAADRPPPLFDELRALDRDLYVIHAGTEAKRPGKRLRARKRTAQWDDYLAGAVEQSIDIGRMKLIGTPPPADEPSAWPGRQLGFLGYGRTLAMGEAKSLNRGILTVRLAAGALAGDTVLVRDAIRTPDGLIETAEPFLTERVDYLPPAATVPGVEESGGPRVMARVGRVDVALLNGVFGDPLIHLRLRHQGRSLLFDLGDGGRLPARLAHQVTDVFISHAHMDHISGFQWLLRSRLGCELPACSVYGPPGLAGHIAGFLRCFLWDRIGGTGPVFEIAELHGERLRRFRTQAGVASCEFIGEHAVTSGVLLEETGFRVRAAVLDHHTPVMAYSFEPARDINVRKDRLKALGLAPGPWLAALKQQLLAGNRNAMIGLPDGSARTADSLADDLVLIKPGKRLVYATDLADTASNRERLAALARHAHTFFCEAPFAEADTEQASRTGHLTTRACGEIAAAAGVGRLVPFHFSRRYREDPQFLYEEIRAVCGRVAMPRNPRSPR